MEGAFIIKPDGTTVRARSPNLERVRSRYKGFEVLKEEGMSRLSKDRIAYDVPQVLETSLVYFLPELMGKGEENGVEGYYRQYVDKAE